MAALAESQQGIEDGDNVDHDVTGSYSPILYDNYKIEQGVNVLKTLFPLDGFDDIFEARRNNCSARTPAAILVECWHSLKDIFRGIKQASDKESALRELSRLLFDNTAKPLPLPGNSSMSEFAKSFTGRLSRWEAIGVVASGLGIFRAGRELCKRSALEELSKPPSWQALIEASNACLSFCNELGSINDVLLWMLGENTILQTLFHGDASKFSYPSYYR